MITMMTHNLSMDQLRLKAPAIPAVHSVSRAMRRELLEVPKGGEEDRRKGAFEGARFSTFFFEFVSGFRRLNWSCCLFFVMFGGGAWQKWQDGCNWAPESYFIGGQKWRVGDVNWRKRLLKERCFWLILFWEPPHKKGSDFFSNIPLNLVLTDW